jgi:predicted TIM-barrel fold metal-dependent hydrolase
VLVTDAQVHLWLPKPGGPPPQGAGTEQRPNGHSPEELIAEMAEAGVDRAVVVPPGALCTNEEAQAFCDAHPGRLALMGALDAEAPGAQEQLAGWMDRPHMLGTRLGFSSGGVFKPSFDDGTLDWFWNDAERLRIPLMILVGGMSARTYPIAERHPGLTLIIDHMARPSRAAGAGSWADLDDLLSLSRLPNVYVKLSSAPNYSDEPYPYRDIHPFLRRIYDAFGPRRLMWGTDLTRLRGSYRECRLLFQEALTFLSAEDREWILGRSLAETLHWSERDLLGR